MALQQASHQANPNLDTAMQDFVGDAAVGDAALVTSKSLARLPLSNIPTSYLPNEILLEVFSHLEKPDLISVRLVSKDYSQLAADSLFEKIYISPSFQDVYVFTKITHHPTLARCIRTLAYDVSEFNISSLAEYRSLCRSYFRRLFLRCPELASRFSLHELEDLTNLPRSEAYTDYHLIFEEGFRKYSRQKIEQGRYQISKAFFISLCAGLAKMTGLRKIAFEYRWKDHPAEMMRLWSLSPHQPLYSASSLARSWNPYHLKPSRPGLFHLTYAFLYTLDALSVTGQSVKEIHFAHSLKLPDSTFDSKCVGSHNLPKCYLSTTQNLRNLTISIKHLSNWEPYTEKTARMDLFESILFNAPNLKYLCLLINKSGRGRRSGEPRPSLSQVFPNKKYPKNLVYLRLEGIRSSEEELSGFFQCLSELRHLALENIDIERGCWKDLMKSILNSTALRSFRMRALRELMTGLTVSLASLA